MKTELPYMKLTTRMVVQLQGAMDKVDHCDQVGCDDDGHCNGLLNGWNDLGYN